MPRSGGADRRGRKPSPLVLPTPKERRSRRKRFTGGQLPAPPLDNPIVEIPSGAYPADYVNPRHGGLANLAGVPAISVPVGRSAEGLPIALQLMASWGADELLLDAAEALENANGRVWVDAAPPLAG